MCENGGVGVSWAFRGPPLPATQKVLEGSSTVLAVCLACKVGSWGRCGGSPTPISLGHSPDSLLLWTPSFGFMSLAFVGTCSVVLSLLTLTFVGAMREPGKGNPGQEERTAHQPCPLAAAAQVSPLERPATHRSALLGQGPFRSCSMAHVTLSSRFHFQTGGTGARPASAPLTCSRCSKGGDSLLPPSRPVNPAGPFPS